ncbi:MAG: hypothetical protein RL701_1268 [Pseudomonadota bacterium]
MHFRFLANVLGGAVSLGLCLSACNPSSASSGKKPNEDISAGHVGGTRQPFSIHRVEKADVLFVVDNSNSMAGEQAALREQVPHLIEVLTRGERFPGDPQPFTPIRDLHVGVVSTDLGTNAITGLGSACSPEGGDDGKLLHAPTTPLSTQCRGIFPTFLSYTATDDLTQVAHDVACIADLGTGGCGFEQQLEAPLKALWPADYHDDQGELVTPNPIQFLGGRPGRGDLPTEQGGNLGFLRNDPNDPALLVIVLLTDEEDGSVMNNDHLWPSSHYAKTDPLATQDINLRLYFHPEQSFAISRYVDGFRKLKPGHEELVVFTAIAGVPPDLVDSNALDAVDFADAAARAAFYDHILDDPRMQQVPDEFTGTGKGNLKTSCERTTPGEDVAVVAYPPRRIVELAQAFGENGMVQSICQDDFTGALDKILDAMAKPLAEMCTPESLVRGNDGLVDCKMYWRLPVAGADADADAPHTCAELGALLAADAEPVSAADGAERCEVQQLQVQDGQAPEGLGWYYDDFTAGLDRMCVGGLSRRIAFTEGARPARGVSVQVDCSGSAGSQP